MWAEEMVMYQIYPLGMCGAPKENDGVTVSRILTVKNSIPHLQKLGVNAVYFGPVFSSAERLGCRTEDLSHCAGSLRRHSGYGRESG